MARIRSIKPEFFTDSDLSELSPLHRLFFAGLWCHVDREGRAEDKPKELKVKILPYDDCNADALLQDLHDAGFIERYVVDGKRYLGIPNFLRHQHPHIKEPQSTIPAPTRGHETPAPDESSSGPVLEPGQSVGYGKGVVMGREGNGSGNGHGKEITTEVANSATSSSAKPRDNVKTHATWSAFAFAYQTRYGVEPVRNAKVNGQLAKVVDRLGEEAPQVAGHYVKSNRALYVSSKHCVDLLLRDCEGLRTEWATGRTVTDTEARQADRKQNNLGIAEKLIAESRANAGK